MDDILTERPTHFNPEPKQKNQKQKKQQKIHPQNTKRYTFISTCAFRE